MDDKELLRVTQELFGIRYRKDETWQFHYHFYNTPGWMQKHSYIMKNPELIKQNSVCVSKSSILFCLSINLHVIEIIGYFKSNDFEVTVYSEKIEIDGHSFHLAFYFDLRRDRYEHNLVDIVEILPDNLMTLFRNEDGMLQHSSGLLTKSVR